MRLAALAQRLAGVPALAETLALEADATLWSNCAAEARPLLVAAAYHAQPRKILLIANSYERALQWQARLGLFGIPKDRIRLLPSGLSVLFEDAAPETVALSDRIGSLRFLSDEEPGVVIATPQAALERTLPAEDLRDHFLQIRPHDRWDAMDLVDRLVRLGYEPSEPVRVPGQFSRRGGILDVFPTGAERPVRIEFFDDEVESLRVFDPNSQRSLRKIETLDLSLTRETLLPTPELGLSEWLERSLELETATLDEEAGRSLENLVRGDIQALEQRIFFDRLDLYRPSIQPDGPCAIDYLQPEDLLILDEPLELNATAHRGEEELSQALDARHQRGEILRALSHDFVWPADHFGDAARVLTLTAMNGVPDGFPRGNEVDLAITGLETFQNNPTGLTQAMKNWLDAGLCVVMGTDQPMRSKSVLSQVEIFPTPTDQGHPFESENPDLPPGFFVFDGNPACGFVAPSLGLAMLSDHELFGVARLKLPQRKFTDGVPVTTVLDLKPGDHVVHINFGIGVYMGLIKREIDGIEKEFLHIEYQAPDRLFVPADQLDRIQKYLAPGDAPPKINRLTGGEWKKTVGKAREEAREFARELIQLYAQRKRVERPGYGGDSPWMGEMEATFPWAETPSQLAAIDEVKTDLRLDYPMDRLVCGDVGFGKTEVAIRAAFKVAEAGKQVAVLCPTTILSEQHYRNFQERLAPFPTNLALLNRFVHGKERTMVREGLKDGSIDIVIGTHALLSDELRFKDLGLLIIDEEQKFGVKHKEALKSLRVNVDVLSMSATPIPRTLSMALMNIRQMSLINDPPPGRLPIRTFVRPYSNEVVREAILREMARGGQVYYVYNRVEGIYHVAERIRKLIPTARIAVGHGQMHEKELEPVMVGFIKGEIDILISTTIVESGLDIPNANTLIVEDADKFGLSPLYQLRGRVGRSDRQAYAYFLFEGAKALTEGATERLRALAEFSQLGAGYSLAFRDLQIRGAGDLLGAKQSGQMNAVGYDLYSQLIESEVQFLKNFADGERPKELTDPLAGLEPLPSFDLPVKALIPQSYIEDQGQRLFYYQLMMAARDLARLNEISGEMEDRYGHQPAELLTALAVMAARIKARDLGVWEVDGKGGRLAITLAPTRPLHPRVYSIVQGKRREIYMSGDQVIYPFTGDPVDAAHTFLDLYGAAQLQAEEERATALGSRG